MVLPSSSSNLHDSIVAALLQFESMFCELMEDDDYDPVEIV